MNDNECLYKKLSRDKRSTTFLNCNEQLKYCKDVCNGYNNQCEYFACSNKQMVLKIGLP